MKLWKKLSLICSSILVFIVLISSILLLDQSKDRILSITYEQARNKQTILASSFSEMVSYYADERDTDAASYALVRYCFSRFADSSSVLLKDNLTIYSEVSVSPADYLLVDSYEQQQYTGIIDGHNILIVGNKTIIQNTAYQIYVVMDISDVYNSIAQMAWRFAAIGLLAVAFGSALIVLLVRHATMPLIQLSASTKRIAAGNYEGRAIIQAHDEIGELAEDFNVMANAVHQNIRTLTETALRQRLFIGGVTHEFKTPLTTIMLNVDTLQNAFMDEDERQHSLANIARQCNWLVQMIQKLLKLITLREQIELRQASLPLLLERVRESMQGLLSERRTPLEFDCAIDTINMDIDLMQSALINLVDNASKASKPGDPVVIRAYNGIIEIQDYGCGIPEGDHERILEPFYMVDKSRNKNYGGSGLGLALVSEIVAAHGAKMHIESKLGEGTKIRIDFAR